MSVTSVWWSHHGHVSLEDLLDELVPGRVDELDDVGVEAVSVFLQEAWKKDGEIIKDKGGDAWTRAPDCGTLCQEQIRQAASSAYSNNS